MLESKIVRIIALGVLVTSVTLTPPILAQQGEESSAGSVPDPFEYRVPELKLENDDIFRAITRIAYNWNIPLSFEGVRPPKRAGAPPPPPTFDLKLSGMTFKEVLEHLFSLDPRYTWSRNGNMLNIYPTPTIGDQSYVFNRIIPRLVFREVRSAGEAYGELRRNLPGPKVQVALVTVGNALNYSKPWTATFENITARQAMNHIAQQLGPTYGWTLAGTQEFSVVMFHYRMKPRRKVPPKAEVPPLPQ